MKAFGISMLLSGFLISALGIAAMMYGVHSTPCIWLTLANLPGIALVAWVSGWVGFPIAVFVNSLLYFSAFKLMSALKRISS